MSIIKEKERLVTQYMSNYKDHFIQGLPEKNNKNESSNEKDILALKVKDIINKLISDPELDSDKKNQLVTLDKLEGSQKELTYKKILEIYNKYKNFPDYKRIMFLTILRTIESNYQKQLREQANNKKRETCNLNGHKMEETWTKSTNYWYRKCQICGYRQRKVKDPSENNNDTKGSSRKRKPKDNK